MQLADRGVQERLGAARLTFKLVAADGRLKMVLGRRRFLGLPCPAWLHPQVTAEEFGDGDRFQFCVRAVLPWVGRVASYRGHLNLPLKGCP